MQITKITKLFELCLRLHIPYVSQLFSNLFLNLLRQHASLILVVALLTLSAQRSKGIGVERDIMS